MVIFFNCRFLSCRHFCQGLLSVFIVMLRCLGVLFLFVGLAVCVPLPWKPLGVSPSIDAPLRLTISLKQENLDVLEVCL